MMLLYLKTGLNCHGSTVISVYYDPSPSVIDRRSSCSIVVGFLQVDRTVKSRLNPSQLEVSPLPAQASEAKPLKSPSNSSSTSGASSRSGEASCNMF